MTARKKRILRWLAIVILGGLAFAAYTILSPSSWLNRPSSIACTCAWGRLAPFPVSAQHLDITTEGSAFTRAFRVTFTAPPADIEQWLQQSPGTRDVQATSPSPGIRHFRIEPGEGAAGAELTVDDTKHQVDIYVYWS